MRKLWSFVLALCLTGITAQVQVARDTITVLENGRVLKLPWANGLNHANVSVSDLNADQKKDLVFFDRVNSYGVGRFRCFIHTGAPGVASYRYDPLLSYYFPTTAYWALLRDYNGDGKDDLFCSATGGIKVYKNTSTPQNILQFTLVKQLLYSDYGSPGNPLISNLYASSVGVPAIADVDGDGDLDVLTFSSLGVHVEFHKNIRVENNWPADSLAFQRADYCWGDFSESNCSVSFNQCPVRKMWDSLAAPANPNHAGACLTCLDNDSDGDQDLIIGDVSCTTVQYVHNSGTALASVFNDTTVLFPNYPAKNSNGTHINMNIFPCTYYLDVDGDNKKDLIATPNVFGTENFKSVWLYRNVSSTATASLQLVKTNFMQDEMIEVGQNSFPLLLDHNADGKKDLLIGNHGYYINGSQQARLTLYENKGTLAQPVFSLVSRDYAGIGQQNLNHVMPAVGDVDGDGDIDICIGNSSGQVHWLENTAGAGKPCNFSVFRNNPFGFTTPSGGAAPQLFDLDADGKLDLLIGMKNGRIAYYRNTSTGATPTFSLISSFLGGVEVKGDPNLYGVDGYAVPFFYREGAQGKLLVGSVSGQISAYNFSSAAAAFTLVSKDLGYLEGGQSTVWYEDVNGDAKRDLFIGNASGGLSFFSSASPFVGVPELHDMSETLRLFPNPANEVLHVKVPEGWFLSQVEILNAFGAPVLTRQSNEDAHEIGISALPAGIYFVKVSGVFQGRPVSASGKFLIAR